MVFSQARVDGAGDGSPPPPIGPSRNGLMIAASVTPPTWFLLMFMVCPSNPVLTVADPPALELAESVVAGTLTIDWAVAP